MTLEKTKAALEFYANGYEEMTHENNGKFYTVIEVGDSVSYDEGKTAKEALVEFNAHKKRIEELEAWFENTWMKGVPDVGRTVLINHELGAGDNYDVACYMGKDKKGDDIFMMSNGTQIFRAKVIRWRSI